MKVIYRVHVYYSTILILPPILRLRLFRQVARAHTFLLISTTDLKWASFQKRGPTRTQGTAEVVGTAQSLVQSLITTSGCPSPTNPVNDTQTYNHKTPTTQNNINSTYQWTNSNVIRPSSGLLQSHITSLSPTKRTKSTAVLQYRMTPTHLHFGLRQDISCYSWAL
jgi:hypothetical protein